LGRKVHSRLKTLKQWKKIVEKAALTINKLYPEAELYVTGGAAEERLTINSDIDILVVFSRKMSWKEKVEALAKIWERLEEEIPEHYILEIHILEKNEASKIKCRKIKIT